MKPVVIFALATGLRRSNITDLEWSQIDMQRKVAWIHLEDAKARRAIGVALNESACKVRWGNITGGCLFTLNHPFARMEREQRRCAK